jgi:hypothetical protein
VQFRTSGGRTASARPQAFENKAKLLLVESSNTLRHYDTKSALRVVSLFSYTRVVFT